MLRLLRSYSLYGVVLMFILLSGMSFYQYTRNTALLSSHIQLSAWSLAQLELEQQKFYTNIKLFRAGAIDHETLMFSYDMFWNRLSVFMEGDENEALRGRFDAATIVGDLFTTLKSYANEIDKLTPANQQRLTEMERELQPYNHKIRTLMVLNFTGPDALNSMDSIANERHHLAIAIAGMVLSGLILVVYLLGQKREAQRLAGTDALTGLYNRSALRHELRRQIARHRPQDTCALALIDMSRFREVNSALGQAKGDEILRQIARMLKRHARHHDVVARLDSDHFAVLLPRLTTREEALGHLHLLQQMLITDYVVQDRIFQLEARIGMTFLTPEASEDTLISEVSLALAEAKRQNLNTPLRFVSELGEQATRSRILLESLRDLLQRHDITGQELRLVYQPLYTLDGRQMCGVEALVRWNHPQLGVVAPLELVEVVENNRLGVAFGEWVFARIGEDRLHWPSHLSMAVNLTPSLFNPALPNWLASQLAKSGLAPQQLMIEITENTTMVDFERSQMIISRVREMGVRVALDDFGTGYSSLSYLRELRVDKLKIDKSFIKDLDIDEDQRVFVKSIVDLAHYLGVKVVAEGIESLPVESQAQGLGCDEGQGFYFARPQEVEGLQHFMEERRLRSGIVH